jgi:hypothetical protein
MILPPCVPFPTPRDAYCGRRWRTAALALCHDRLVKYSVRRCVRSVSAVRTCLLLPFCTTPNVVSVVPDGVGDVAASGSGSDSGSAAGDGPGSFAGPLGRWARAHSREEQSVHFDGLPIVEIRSHEHPTHTGRPFRPAVIVATPGPRDALAFLWLADGTTGRRLGRRASYLVEVVPGSALWGRRGAWHSGQVIDVTERLRSRSAVRARRGGRGLGPRRRRRRGGGRAISSRSSEGPRVAGSETHRALWTGHRRSGTNADALQFIHIGRSCMTLPPTPGANLVPRNCTPAWGSPCAASPATGRTTLCCSSLYHASGSCLRVQSCIRRSS